MARGITAAEVKRQQRANRKEREQGLRQKDRERLKLLRSRLKDSRGWRRDRLRAIVAMCKRARLVNRERAREIRARYRREANEEIERLRSEARKKCESRKLKARAKGDDSIARAMRNLKEERDLQRTERIWSGRTTKKTAGPKKKKTTAAELRAESDDRVRGNIPAELVPVFNKVKAKIKESPRRTRTEAFLQWAHDHPGRAQEILDAQIEKDVAQLVKEEQRLREYVMKPQKYARLSERELTKRYAAYQGAPEVPF